MRFERGQGLVETAVVTPILILLLIGVFEVGWALRTYMVLANANREAARFAVRPGYLDLHIEQPDYLAVYNHALKSIAEQVPFTETGVMRVSVWSIDAQEVCDPEHLATCDCEQAVSTPYSPTIVLSHLDIPTYTWVYPYTSTQESRIEATDYISRQVSFERRWVCESSRKDVVYVPHSNIIITVEMWYRHPQLFGFPLISNPLTDPMPMYMHTAMRQITSRRSPNE